MLYELHLTTDPNVELFEWKLFWRRMNVKPLDIRLVGEDAKNPRQIMMSATTEGDHLHALYWTFELQDEMIEQGFPLRRAKLEIPLDKAEAYQGRINYYEAHVKSLVAPEYFDEVVEEAEDFGWYVSYNALYKHVDGFFKTYLTKRVPGNQNYIEAGKQLSKAFGRLDPHQFNTIRMESEAVIVDTFPQMDEGWTE